MPVNLTKVAAKRYRVSNNEVERLAIVSLNLTDIINKLYPDARARVMPDREMADGKLVVTGMIFHLPGIADVQDQYVIERVNVEVDAVQAEQAALLEKEAAEHAAREQEEQRQARAVEEQAAQFVAEQEAMYAEMVANHHDAEQLAGPAHVGHLYPPVAADEFTPAQRDVIDRCIATYTALGIDISLRTLGETSEDQFQKAQEMLLELEVSQGPGGLAY